MEFFKKLFVGAFVLLVSAAIFYFFINDEKMKDDILRTTLETLGNEVLALAPDSESKSRLEKQFNDFLSKVGNNELSEAQIQTTAASILNLKMEPEQATPEIIEAVLEVHIDSASIKPGSEFERPESLNRKKLAGQIKQMMQFQEEMAKMSNTDSLVREIRERVIFSADSGLKIWVSPQIMDEHVFVHNPEFLRRLHKLQEQNVIQFYNVNQMSELGLAGLKFAAPFLSPEDRREIRLYLQQNPPPPDSLNFERFILHPDSLSKIIEIYRTAERQIREMEEWDSVKD